MGFTFLFAPPAVPPALRDCCAGWWDAERTDRSDKTLWADASGNGRDMDLFNCAGLPSDGWSETRPPFLRLDGIDSYCARTDMPVTGTDPCTIAALMKADPAQTGDRFLFAYGTPGVPGAVMGLYVRAANPFVRMSAWNESLPIDYNTGFSKDALWHFWTLVFDGANVRVYRDGAADPAGAKPAPICFSDPNFQITCVARYIGAEIGAAGVFAKALSADEVRLLFARYRRRAGL